MNKKLIALAIAGACVAPEAIAQTANPVTLYGRAYLMLESVEAKGGASINRRNRITDQASLLGVRGTEDLGGGMKVFFQLETAFAPDQAPGTFANRNSGVGLQGGFGSVLIGRWDTPFKLATITIDPFGDLTIGGLTAAMQGSGPSCTFTSGSPLTRACAPAQFDRRDNNVIQYWSPSIGGFAFRYSHMVNEGRTGTTNPRNDSASLTFTRGPIYAGVAWDQMKDAAYGTATPGKQEAGAIFGNFTFGAFKAGLLYEEFKRSGFTKQKAWMGNIVWTLGKNQFMYQHQQTEEGGASSAATQPECDVDALGYQYNFTRRTFFIATYARVDNNAASACDFGSTRLGVAPGQDPRGFGLGIRHVF